MGINTPVTDGMACNQLIVTKAANMDEPVGWRSAVWIPKEITLMLAGILVRASCP